MKQRRVLTVAIAGILMMALTAIPSTASNFGSIGSAGISGTTNGVFLHPSRTMVVQRINLTDYHYSAVASRVTNVYSPTDLVASSVSGNSTGCTVASGATVCVYDSPYGSNGLYGWSACAGTVTGSGAARRCSVQWVRLNLSYVAPSTTRLVCHELAHTVGLRHTTATDTCVTEDIRDTTSATLSSHDVSHINANY